VANLIAIERQAVPAPLEAPVVLPVICNK